MRLPDFIVAAIRRLSQRLGFLRKVADARRHRLRRVRLEAQVARYCAEGYADEDRDLVAFQAFDLDDD